MQIIKAKKYEGEKEVYELDFVSYNSKGTLSFVMLDGTHYNFNDKELRRILDFVKEITR